jgi:hypothetical protein
VFVIGNADAITYELVKNAIAYYYDNMINSTRRVEITKDNDKKGLNLSTVFKVYDEDKHQYTLIFYQHQHSSLIFTANFLIHVRASSGCGCTPSLYS